MSVEGLVRVEEIRPGDSVTVGTWPGSRVVDEVVSWDDGESWQLVYWSHSETSYENRARDRSGGKRVSRLCLKSTVSWAAGTLLPVERGDLGVVKRLRRQYAETVAQRLARAEERAAQSV